jgi:uncharacterized membrane protein
MEIGKPVEVGKSEIGNLDGNIAALLSYLFAPIASLIFFFGEKKNDFIRFHAMQSLILGVINVIISVLIGPITCGIGYILLIPVYIFLIIALVKSVQKQYYKIPVLGNLAEKWSVQQPQTPPTPPPAA